MILKNIAFILSLIPSICFGQSDDPYFTNISLKNGLSQGTVYCVYQDDRNFMWFGTGDGLNRYDGYNFTVYKHVPADTTTISNSLINCITGDKSGNIWVGTTNGLNCFDPSTEQFKRYFHIPDSNSISNNYVKSLFMDSNGHLWIGTDYGLNRLDISTGRFTNYDFDGKLNDSRIYCILEDSSGDFWVASRKAGLLRFNPESFQYTQYNHHPSDPYSISSDHVYSLYEDSKKQLWVGTWEYGVNRFNRETEKFERLKTKKDGTGLNNEQIRCIIENKDGNIWIGTFEGLNIYNTKTDRFTYCLRHNNVSGSLSYNTINYLYEDRAGSIWLGTFGGGVDLYNPSFSQFKLIDPKTIANHDYGYVGSIVEHNWKIWIGTEGGGLACYDLKTNDYKYYGLSDPTNEIVSSNTIRDLCVDRNNKLWIGTYAAGISTFDLSTQKFERHFDKSNGIDNNIVNDIHEDSNGNIWVGSNSEEGIHFKNRDGNKFTAGFSLNADGQHINLPWIRAIAEPAANEFWFGSIYYGLFICKDGQIKNISTGNSDITSDYISVITKDSKDRVWVGTYGGGVNIFDRENRIISSLTVADGLPNDNICSIIEDSLANMWISTISGICHFNTTDSSFTNYSYQKGNFPIEILNLKSGLYASDGNIYFGGSNGLAYFSPKNILANEYIPPVTITQLFVNNKIVKPFDETGILNTSVHNTAEITLTHDRTNISIEFAALNYIYPQNNQFMFYLEGYDNTWNEPNFQRRATYTNLPSGQYTFRIKASNNSGAWNEQGAQLLIRILPPPWKTWWAYCLYFIVLVAVTYTVMHYFMAKIKYRNEIMLKQLEKATLEQTHQMRINLFTNFSHELRTPLTLILDPLKKILSDSSLPVTYQDSLQLIYKNAKRILTLVNQLMDFRKQESGHLKIKVQEGDVVKFIREITIIFRELTHTRNIRLQFHCIEKEIRMYFDPFLLEKVLYNILSNAVKNTPENGVIQVGIGFRSHNKAFSSIHPKQKPSLPQASSYVEIVIKDTGKGISQDDLEKIFDPFFQVDEHGTAGVYGTGIGLYITKGIVELHHGVIWAESKPYEGATFKIILPIELSLYKKEELASKENNYIIENKPDIIDSHFSKDIETPPIKGNPLILIVDDNAEIRSYISAHLKSEFITYEAENGDTALQLAQKLIPDLIISDIMMPVMDGLELSRKLKSEIKTSHIPIILLTARSTILQIKEGLGTGADDYVSKPFDADLLKAKVKSLIDNRRRLKEAYIKSFNIDLPTQEITNIDEIFLERAYNFVKENIANSDLSIEEFGKQLFLSRTQLYRKIKALTGMSPSLFISTLRLKLAAELLFETSLSVSEISYKVGFGTPSYFTTSFKRLYGVSPKEYTASKKLNK